MNLWQVFYSTTYTYETTQWIGRTSFPKSESIVTKDLTCHVATRGDSIDAVRNEVESRLGAGSKVTIERAIFLGSVLVEGMR